MTEREQLVNDIRQRGIVSVIPIHWNEAKMQQVLDGVYPKPQFLGRVGDRHRFYVSSDGKVTKRIIKSEG